MHRPCELCGDGARTARATAPARESTFGWLCRKCLEQLEREEQGISDDDRAPTGESWADREPRDPMRVPASDADGMRLAGAA
jgi:hypothetical protein